MVSKAADSLRVMTTVVRPIFTASYILLTIFKSAVSIEWNYRYAALRKQNDGVMCSSSLAKYRCLSTLLMMFRFNIGLQLAGSVMLRINFFRSDAICAILNHDGKMLSVKERLASFVMIAAKTPLHSFTAEAWC